jgi:hypothetical protein
VPKCCDEEDERAKKLLLSKKPIQIDNLPFPFMVFGGLHEYLEHKGIII